MAKDPDRHFSKEDMQMANKHIKKTINSISHQGNANQNHNEIPLYVHRMARIKKCWWRYVEIGTLVLYWWECKMVQPLWKTIWQFLKCLNIWSCYHMTQQFHSLGICWRDMNTYVHTNICTLMFIEVSFIIAKTWKQLSCLSTDKWTKCGIYIQQNIIPQ